VDVFKLNLPLIARVRPQTKPSYSLMNWMLASTTVSAASPRSTRIISRRGHMNGAGLKRLSIGFTPLAEIDELAPCITEPSRLSARKLNNRHVIVKLDRSNSELLFATIKGTSNAELKDGEPGEKTGSFGQGGPQSALIKRMTARKKATTARGVPTIGCKFCQSRHCLAGGARPSRWDHLDFTLTVAAVG